MPSLRLKLRKCGLAELANSGGVKQMAETYIVLFGIVGIALLCSIGLFIGTTFFLK
jgi:hypothetical protein